MLLEINLRRPLFPQPIYQAYPLAEPPLETFKQMRDEALARLGDMGPPGGVYPWIRI